MSGENIDIEMTATDKGVLDVLGRQVAMMDKLEKRMTSVGKEAAKASQKTKSGFDQATATAANLYTKITGVASGVDLVMKAASALKSEYDALVQRQQKSADAQRSLDDVNRSTLLNTRGVFSPAELTAENSRIAEATGVDQRVVSVSLGSAVSAGAKSKAQAIDAVESAAVIGGHNPTLMQELSGGSLDIANKLDMTPQQGMGLMLQAAQMSRVESFENMAKNFAPSVANLDEFGGDAAENTALWAALNQATKDRTGNETFTNTVSIAKSLEDFLPELSETDERIQYMQQNPEAANAFLYGGEFNGKEVQKASLEAKYFAPVRSLFDPEGAVARNYAGNKQKLADPDANQDAYNQSAREQRELPTNTTTEIQKRSTATADAMLTDNVEAGTAGAARAAFDTVQASTTAVPGGRKFINKQKMNLRLLRGDDPLEVYRDSLVELEQQERDPNWATKNAGFVVTDRNRREATPEQTANADKILKLTEQTNALLERNNQIQTAINSEQRKATAAPNRPEQVPGAALGKPTGPINQ